MARYKKDLTTYSGRFEENYRLANRMAWGGIPFFFSLPFVFLYIYAMFRLQNFWLCQGVNSCKVWGDVITRAGLLGIFAVPFFASVVDYFFLSKFSVKNWLPITRKFILITSCLLPIGLFIFFNVYTKTTQTYLEIGGIYNLGLFNNYKIPYDKIIGIGSTSIGSTTSRYNSCKMLPYIVLQDKDIIFLYGALNDHSLIEYLHAEKHISTAIGLDNMCR